MATVTKAANAHTVVSTGWTTASNAYGTSTDTNYATALNGTTTKNISHTGDFGFPDFSSSDIPDGATITSVTINCGGVYLSATGLGVLFGVQGYNNGSAIGSEVTETAATSPTLEQYTYSTVPSLSDLRSASTLLKARARGAKGNTASTFTVYLDYVSMTVVYSADVSVNATIATGTGSAANDTAKVGASATTGTGTGEAINAVGRPGEYVSAGLAEGTGLGLDATAETAAGGNNWVAGLAEATGAVLAHRAAIAAGTGLAHGRSA